MFISIVVIQDLIVELVEDNEEDSLAEDFTILKSIRAKEIISI